MPPDDRLDFCRACGEEVETDAYGDYRCEECGYREDYDGPEPDYDAVSLEERHHEAWKEKRYG